MKKLLLLLLAASIFLSSCKTQGKENTAPSDGSDSGIPTVPSLSNGEYSDEELTRYFDSTEIMLPLSEEKEIGSIRYIGGNDKSFFALHSIYRYNESPKNDDGPSREELLLFHPDGKLKKHRQSMSVQEYASRADWWSCLI